MPNISFTKMHGLGNDFVVIDGINQRIAPKDFSISKLADRHVGIGFDQLLLLEPSQKADVFCRIFNSDGSEAEQCGNGMRCVARFIRENQLSSTDAITIETKAGVVKAVIHDFNNIVINMGQPLLEEDCELNIAEHGFKLSVLSMGNPHAVLRVDSVDGFPVKELGKIISTHGVFPKGVNVGFMQVMAPDHIRLRTFERGAGETLACGSNSSAAVVAGIQKGLLDNKVRVELAMGSLMVEWDGADKSVYLSGEAVRVFDGSFVHE